MTGTGGAAIIVVHPLSNIFSFSVPLFYVKRDFVLRQEYLKSMKEFFGVKKYLKVSRNERSKDLFSKKM